MKQAKINGGASSQVPTFRFPIMDEPPLRMQRTPAPYFMNGQSERPRKRFAYESPIEELYYDRSVVPMEKPLENIEIEDDTSCIRADQYGKKLRFKDFCRHPDVALPEGFKIPKFSKYNGVGDPYHHLLSFCGDCRGLDSQPGLFLHLYQKSLEGEALKWNSSLPLDALRSFYDVIDRFTSQ